MGKNGKDAKMFAVRIDEMLSKAVDAEGSRGVLKNICLAAITMALPIIVNSLAVIADATEEKGKSE